MIKPRVVLLFGGQSGEHQISCATAASVLEAIDRDRFEVIPIGITTDGQWVKVPDDAALYRMENGEGAVIKSAGETVSFWAGTNALMGVGSLPEEYRAGGVVEAEDLGRIDVVLPLLHGPFGEDGFIQGYLESCDVRYVGCGVAASAVCMDKHLTKTVLRASGIAVGRWTQIPDRLWQQDRSLALEQAASVGPVVYVKPNRAGSSLGVSRVDDLSDLEQAIEQARVHDPNVIVEAEVKGREIECGVLEFADGPRASVCGEIAVSGNNSFYDFKHKYQVHDAVQIKCPTQLPENIAKQIQEISVEAFEAVRAEGLARVDFFYQEASGEVILSEINTMPGMTPWSMYPGLWAASGVQYRDLLTQLIEAALARPSGLR
ncbi:MAG: D-alanine--D-alanine ligase family protein [Actinomycetaceae bacterium]|nr:D-alanine--D-alanine ligase family protein [Actinomycetaceae bacterium]